MNPARPPQLVAAELPAVNICRRQAARLLVGGAALVALGNNSQASSIVRTAPLENDRWTAPTKKGLDWLAKQQSRSGAWISKTYPAAVTALSGMALISSGSTTTQGPYAKQIRIAVDYLLSKARFNGLIGDPKRDQRYT